MFGHWGEGKREVALYQDRGSPPFRPCVVSFGVVSKSWGANWGANLVEFREGRVGWVVKYEGVWLGLESERVVVNVGGSEGDCVGLLGMGPGRGGLDGVGCL